MSIEKIKQTWKKYIVRADGSEVWISSHPNRVYNKPVRNGGKSVCLGCGAAKSTRRVPKATPARVDETAHASGCTHPGYGTEEVPYLWSVADGSAPGLDVAQ